MGRTVGCLILGALLWAGWGAVRGVPHWEVSADGYLVAMAVTGFLVGLVSPGPRFLTGTLLVTPGLGALLAAGPTTQHDLAWWLLTLVVAASLAALTHWLGIVVRSRLRHFAGSRTGR